MEKVSKNNGMLDLVVKFFESIKLTVVILILLSATSIIGTLIPQNKKPEAYIETFGEIPYTVMHVFDIFDMYHSWWFQSLIIILAINIIVCSYKRLSGTWKIVFSKKPKFSMPSFTRQGIQEEFTDQRQYQQLQNLYESYLKNKFSFFKVEKSNSGVRILAEKGRWTRFGVYVVHFSIVLLLKGKI